MRELRSIAAQLPGNPIVVEYVPQLEVIAQSSLTITHGGLNTVLDSLGHGVPIVAIPITFEQPGTGSRIRWIGVGEVIPVDRLSVPILQSAIRQVLTNPLYRQNARRIQQAIERSGGVGRAADIVERVAQPKRKSVVLSAV